MSCRRFVASELLAEWSDLARRLGLRADEPDLSRAAFDAGLGSRPFGPYSRHEADRVLVELTRQARRRRPRWSLERLADGRLAITHDPAGTLDTLAGLLDAARYAAKVDHEAEVARDVEVSAWPKTLAARSWDRTPRTVRRYGSAVKTAPQMSAPVPEIGRTMRPRKPEAA